MILYSVTDFVSNIRWFMKNCPECSAMSDLNQPIKIDFTSGSPPSNGGHSKHGRYTNGYMSERVIR